MAKRLKWLTIPHIDEAIAMCKDAPVYQVARYHGIHLKELIQAVEDTGYSEYLNDDGKFDLSPIDFYESQIPPPPPDETREEQLLRIQGAIISYQSNCLHEKYHIRCSRCQKILGSEVTHFSINDLETAVEELLNEGFETPEMFAFALKNRFYEKYFESKV